ncbi:MAG: phage holin family protein [Akkermansiaceae bacterium]|nr:phage holin family protein [Akkermansiaceae bacterium]
MDPETPDRSVEPQASGFKSSLHTLIGSRIALARIEFKQALRERTRAIAFVLVAAMLLFYCWALLMVGLIAAIAIGTEWPWHLITLAFAALHLLGALILVKSASSSARSEPFVNTRSEFKKDCEWLESLQKKPKSKS